MPALASAEVVTRVRVIDEGACPSRAAVVKRLRPLLPGVPIVDDADATTIMVRDEGASYSVSVGDETRTLPDAARRCDERTDAAAVSIALLLAPPEPAPPRPRPPWRTNVDVEVDGRIEGSGSSGPGGGGGARLVVTRAHVGGTLGVGALSPVSLQLAQGAVSLTRVPFDLSLRGTGRWGRFELAGELGFAAIIEVARGEHVTNAVRRTDVDLGLRAALVARVWVARHVGVLAALEATAVPSPLELELHDAGLVGHTPYYWLGGVVGLVLRGR